MEANVYPRRGICKVETNRSASSCQLVVPTVEFGSNLDLRQNGIDRFDTLKLGVFFFECIELGLD